MIHSSLRLASGFPVASRLLRLFSTSSRNMDFKRPNKLTNRQALHIVSGFFTQEWSQLKDLDISVTRAQVGLNNEIYFVSRPPADDKRHKEPDKLVIRLFSSIARDLDPESGVKQSAGMWISPIEETVVCLKMADKGLGPQIHGLFAGGRIEEFVECHNMRHEESVDPLIERDVAHNLAHFHATRLPMRKPAYDFRDALRSLHENAMQEKDFYKHHKDQEARGVVEHDFESELRFLHPLLDLKLHRLVFMHWDTHFGNIVVLDNSLKDKKTMLMDYEISCYNMRAKDLGTFLLSRSGFFPFRRSDRQIESNDQFSSFLTAYRNEAVKLFPEWKEDEEKETIDHLMVESLVGGMTACLCYLLRFVFLVARKGSGDEADTLSAHMPVLLQGLIECRQALITRYPDPLAVLRCDNCFYQKRCRDD